MPCIPVLASARRIRRQNGYYVLIVKRNRVELEAEVRQLFALPPDPQSPVATLRTVEAGHGWLTIRQIWTSPQLNLALQAEWKDVAQIFLLERRGTRHGKPFFQSVCGLTSLPPKLASPKQLLACMQQHWHIENRCHWRRDATSARMPARCVSLMGTPCSPSSIPPFFPYLTVCASPMHASPCAPLPLSLNALSPYLLKPYDF